MYNVIYYIPSTYLSYNWKFVHFDHFPPILLPPVSGKGEGESIHCLSSVWSLSRVQFVVNP